MPFYRKFRPIVLSPQMQRQADWAYRPDTGQNQFIDPALIHVIDTKASVRITPEIHFGQTT